jgi:hypothetical protein
MKGGGVTVKANAMKSIMMILFIGLALFGSFCGTADPAFAQGTTYHSLKATDSPVFAGLTIGTTVLRPDGRIHTGGAIMGGVNNIAVGLNALGYSTGCNNSAAFGTDAMQHCSTGTANTGLGYDALWSTTSGGGNTAVGAQAGFYTKTGDYNAYLGSEAGKGVENQSHSYNTLIGGQAGYGVTTGNYNSCLGYQTCFYNTSGTRNTIVGSQAGFSSIGSAYSDNVLMGYRAGYVITSNGNQNTIMGSYAGGAVTSGYNNVLLGYSAGSIITTGYSNIIIGVSVNPPAVDSTYRLNIGNSIYGNLTTGYIGLGGPTLQNTLNVSRSGVYGTTPGIDFFATLSSAGGESTVYNSGRIYTKFETNSYAGARLTLAYPTGVNTFVDGLTLKNGFVGIGNIDPQGPLQVTGSSSLPINSLYLTTSAFTYLSTGSVLRFGHYASSGNTYGVIENLTGGGTAAGNIKIGGVGAKISIRGTDFTFPLTVVAPLNDTNNAIFTTYDFANGTTGSGLWILHGALSGNTWTEIGAVSGGATAWNNLILQRGGGNVGIGTTTPTQQLFIANAYHPTMAVGTAGNTDTAKVVQFGIDTDYVIGKLQAYDYAVGGLPLVFNYFGGNVAIGAITAPSARLHLPASAAAANLASLKIDAGIVATTPVSGNVESDGVNLYWTDSGGTRRQLNN